MKLKTRIIASSLCTTAALAAFGNQQPTSNANPAYSQSNVQAQLQVSVDPGADTVHFVRDTADPKIITKTYVLKHADPYSIRPYLREMVQALRVDYNNAAGRSNPDYYNVYSKDNAAKTQKIFVPTTIECIKFADGTGVIMVSAEDYRFEDSEYGMGIDSLVARLDLPGIKNSSGQPKFIYFPANRPASELVSMIKLVGANVSNDTVELIGGKDKVEYDADLNCLFFNTALYSRKNIEAMLKLYDVPHPEVKINCVVYELEAENDGTLGLDFQSWKNNNGVKLFSTGGNYSHDANLINAAGVVTPSGTVNSHYFNFQPSWNTRFLDFLVSKGKAKVVSSGVMSIQNGSTGTMLRKTGMLYAAATPLPDGPNGEKHGNAVNTLVAGDKFKFELKVTPSVTEKMSSLKVEVNQINPIGFESDGSVRTSNYNTLQTVMLGNGRNRFYLGGIDKREVVRDSVGVPLLKDLPIIGWIFSTERESTKKSQLVVVADCELVMPNSLIDEADQNEIEIIRTATADAGEKNAYGYRQFGLDRDR